MGRKLSEDLERLGYKPTEQTHGFRRAFKTIAVANEAPEVSAWTCSPAHAATA